MIGRKIHLAGYHIGKLAAYDIDYPHLLESYHYIKTGPIIKKIEKHGVPVFLDSGAYSAFTQKIEISLEDYARFSQEHQELFSVVSVLDGIGDPEITYTNQKKLEDLGINPIPCFHYGEPIEYLQRYLEEGYQYLSLGGMVPISTGPLRIWLDEIWGKYLTDSAGMPLIRVHGFGLTSISLMVRYPWYSVDSTSWVLTGRFGSIYFPQKGHEGRKIVISDQSPKVKGFDQHFDTLSDKEQEVIRGAVEAKGFTIEDLRSVYWTRDLWNIEIMRSMSDVEITPFKNQQPGFF